MPQQFRPVPLGVLQPGMLRTATGSFRRFGMADQNSDTNQLLDHLPAVQQNESFLFAGLLFLLYSGLAESTE